MNSSNQPSDLLDVLIIGAGISGLSLAHTLQKLAGGRATGERPWRLLITESQGRVGGNITTGEAAGFIWEEGPTSFSPTPALLKLIVDVGLQSELVLADRRLPRYVYWKGQLRPVPMSPLTFATSPLLSGWGKLRAISGALGFVQPVVGVDPGGEETVAQFFSRHLGSEVTERLVAPFVSGVYAGSIYQLSASGAFERIARLEAMGGGLLAGAVQARLANPKPAVDPAIPQTKPGELGSFTRGLQALPQAIAARLKDNLKLNWRVKSLHRTEHQTYTAELSTPEGPQQVKARTVVLTSPAYVAADLLQPLQPQISQTLQQFTYPPVACVVLAYPDTAFKEPLRGFGNLVPRNQGIRTLGTIWSSSLFPGRTPPGWQVLTSFIGGATDPEIANLSSEDIVQVVHQDLQQILLSQAVQPKVLAVHLWPRAIPQYTLGHCQRLNQIDQHLKQMPGLYLCSNYIGGISLGDRVQHGQEKAMEIHQNL
jgi:oxygen-dependent protoporphyrinogen oxidase